ncbi:MAG: hypothetical protein P8M20_11545 [Planctomycetaceae bacterium]|nr:hypothetical protein [Planctomycetaceae bacterium]
MTIEMLTGVIIGLSGGVIFSEFLCERAIDFVGFDYDDPFFSKMSVGIRIPYRTSGLCLRPLVGGVIGALI